MSNCSVSQLRAGGAAAALLTLCVWLLAYAPVDAKAKSSKSYPTAVGVGLSEFRIALYKSRVYGGKLQLNTKNYGEDDHNIAVLRPDGRTVRQVPTVAPKGTVSTRLTINTPGRYKLVCTLADHAARGMATTLTVRKPHKR